jgi:hypothetical protein
LGGNINIQTTAVQKLGAGDGCTKGRKGFIPLFSHTEALLRSYQ